MKIIRAVDIRLEKASEIALVIKRIVGYIGRQVWQNILIKFRACCMKTASASSYQLLNSNLPASVVPEMKDLEACESSFGPDGGLKSAVSDFSTPPSGEFSASDLSADDTVVLKIALLGDCETGKTSFMVWYGMAYFLISMAGILAFILSFCKSADTLNPVWYTAGFRGSESCTKRSSWCRLQVKYVSSQANDKYVQTMGISSMEKICRIRGAKIAFRIWDLGGRQKFMDMVPTACQDAAAILIMFDLTSRPTLNSVMQWYQQARQCNQTAIPVLIGTKFDHFILLPLDIQSTIVKQARLYARAMGAILFFSSVTHNINVHKIFKVITAKLFDLPCNIARNLTVGEPIVDY